MARLVVCRAMARTVQERQTNVTKSRDASDRFIRFSGEQSCSYEMLQNAQPKSARFFGNGNSNADGFSSVEVVTLEQLPIAHLANESLPSRFYHRYKWGASAVGNRTHRHGHA